MNFIFDKNTARTALAACLGIQFYPDSQFYLLGEHQGAAPSFVRLLPTETNWLHVCWSLGGVYLPDGVYPIAQMPESKIFQGVHTAPSWWCHRAAPVVVPQHDPLAERYLLRGKLPRKLPRENRGDLHQWFSYCGAHSPEYLLGLLTDPIDFILSY